MEQAMTCVMLCLLFVVVEGMSIPHKVSDGLEGKTVAKRWISSNSSGSHNTEHSPSMVEIPDTSKQSSLEFEERDDLIDGNVKAMPNVKEDLFYGVDNEDMEDTEADIVLGKRITLEDSDAGSKTRHGSKTSNTHRTHDLGDRLKRQAGNSEDNQSASRRQTAAAAPGEKQERAAEFATGNTMEGQTPLKDQIDPTEDINTTESSGDGEISADDFSRTGPCETGLAGSTCRENVPVKPDGNEGDPPNQPRKEPGNDPGPASPPGRTSVVDMDGSTFQTTAKQNSTLLSSVDQTATSTDPKQLSTVESSEITQDGSVNSTYSSTVPQAQTQTTVGLTMETTTQDTDMESNSTTTAATEVVVLGASCKPPTSKEDCKNDTGVACIDGAYKCLPEYYELGGACIDRIINESFAPRLDNSDEDSVCVTWPELEESIDFELLDYRLRWSKTLAASSADEATGEEPSSSFSGCDHSTKHTRLSGNSKDSINDQSDSAAETPVRFTNDTTACTESLTLGETYDFDVAARVKMEADEAEEDLWYPIQSQRLKPDCLRMEKRELVRVNRTMLVTFHSLRGVFENCYAQVGDGARTKIDCRAFPLRPFVFGVQYQIHTLVTAGRLEEVTCSMTYSVQDQSLVPEQVTELETSNVTSSTFSISWAQPADVHGYLSGYEIYLKTRDSCKIYRVRDPIVTKEDNKIEEDTNEETEGTDGTTENENGDTEGDCESSENIILRSAEGQQTLTFTDLKVNTSYRVEVLALNEKGRGEENVKTVSTASLVPHPPEDFTGVASGISEISLRWIPPKPYPGLTQYVIQVYMLSKWRPHTSTLDDPIHNLMITEYDTNSFTISKLSTATSYEFKMKAVTGAGESRFVTTGPIQTWEIIPWPARFLKVKDLTSHSVTLTWENPENQAGGRTRAFKVLVKDQDGSSVQVFAVVNNESYKGPTQPDVPRLDEEFPPDSQVEGAPFQRVTTRDGKLNTSLKIEKLKPNRVYTFVVIPYNGAGWGEQASVQGRTKNDVPNEPTGFSCTATAMGRGELLASWVPPEPVPGDTSYILRVEEQTSFADADLFRLYRNLTIKGYNQDSFVLRGLRDYWRYRLFIKASTPAGSSEDVEAGICTTLPSAPGRITQLTVSKDYSTNTVLNVHWQCPVPNDRRGRLELFKVAVTPQATTRADIALESIPGSDYDVSVRLNAKGLADCAQPYSYSMQIVPQVSYSIQVSAKVHDVADFGDSYTTTFLAPGAAPPSLPTPVRALVTDEKKSEHVKETSTFWTNLCPTCLVKSTYGEVTHFGVGVCKKGFCDVGSRKNGNVRDYLALVTWKTAKAAQFKLPYQIADTTWKTMIRTEAKANKTRVQFAVGSEKSCVTAPETTSCNGPLPPASEFRVFQFSCTKDGCAESALSDVSMTAAVAKSSDAIVIGGAVSGVAMAIIVLLVIVIVRLRFRKVVDINDKAPMEEVQMSDITDKELPEKSRPIKIKEFEETLQLLHANNNDLFAQEFMELDMDSPVHSMDVGSDPMHRKLNRWSNILPYDHTRVKLQVVDGDEKYADDYINANFIVGYNTDKDYIATQGPLTSTIADFWRMVWEQQVSVIVMLSAFKERDPRTDTLREKVAEYYPQESNTEGCSYDHVVVSWRGKLDNQAWEVRTFHLTHLLEKRSRYVKHFFFKSWTDHKADISPQDLISFTNTVRLESESHRRGPIVVHCSAGVGRTGTFIAVDYLCRYIKKLAKGSRPSKVADVMGSLKGSWRKRKQGLSGESTVDIYGRIIALRECRRYMVQTKSQYAFIYDTAMELIRQAHRADDTTSESGADTESFVSEATAAGGIAGSTEAVYDDVESLKRSSTTL